ncbi:hypothetical protein FS842_005125 [Serendipita sp. 407]|nr:hypothetical protein FS842_005125 [Serendipita sp. 407]
MQDVLAEIEDLSGQIERIEEPFIYAGTYSRVYRGVLKGKYVAVKVLQFVGGHGISDMRRKIQREKLVWARLDHPNILPLYGYAEDRLFHPLGALVSPWCQYGSALNFLSKYENTLSQSDRIELWMGVVRGVQYLHQNNPRILHGDLKPANILIDSNRNPRICDFGLARLFLEIGHTGTTTASPHTGTIRYLSPELSRGAPISTASDVYALGCIGLVFIFSLLPYHWQPDSPPTMMLRDIDNELPPAKRPSKLEVSLEYIWNLIENCFSHDPIQRPSATNILSRTDPTMKDGSGVMGSPISPVKGEEELEPRDQEECLTLLEATKDMARLLPQSGVPHGQSRANKTKRLFTKVSSVLFSVKSPGPKSETLCTVCGVKYTWNFNDQGESLEYCSERCVYIGNSRSTALPILNQQTASIEKAPLYAKCIAPGCPNPRFQDPQGNSSRFCGQRCRDASLHFQSNGTNTTIQGTSNTVRGFTLNNISAIAAVASTTSLNLSVTTCVICKTEAYNVTSKSLFCGTLCIQRASNMAPCIVKVPRTHPKFDEISKYFHWKWRYTHSFKPIKHLYSIINSAASEMKYATYRAEVEKEGRFKAKGRSEGNEIRRFHSTTRQCILGDPGNTQLCSSVACHLCTIIRTAFNGEFHEDGARCGYA